MSNKNDLVNKMVAALLVAAATVQTNAQAEEESPLNSSSSFLAMLACTGSSHGCASQPPVADNTNRASDPYNTRTNSYQTSSTNSSYNTSSPSSSSYNTSSPSSSYNTSSPSSSDAMTGYSRSSTPTTSGQSWSDSSSQMNRDSSARRNESYNTNRGAYNETYQNSYNSNRMGPTNPTYVDSYRSARFDEERSPYVYGKEYGASVNTNTTLNREYNTTSDYDFNRGVATTVLSSATLTEAQLLSMLNPQGRAIYLSLDPEGKSLAIQLASQDSYRDKNMAVKEAQKRMNERRGINPNSR